MPINWSDKAVQDRLLMAVIASNDNNVNVKEVARLYGGDMTYHAVENYLRKFRKEAKNMKAQAEGREVPAPSPARPRTKKSEAPATPKKDGIRTGRISKKKAPAVKVKSEVVEDSLFGGAGSGSDREGSATVFGDAEGGESVDEEV